MSKRAKRTPIISGEVSHSSGQVAIGTNIDLKDVIGQVWQAIEHGVDVRGYLHWTSMDNFEWAQGYSMQFGLIGVDLETQERTVKPSGELFGRIVGPRLRSLAEKLSGYRVDGLACHLGELTYPGGRPGGSIRSDGSTPIPPACSF